MNNQRIVFRADGNATIGSGHISRCVALAELLSDRFEITFAVCDPAPHIANEITRLGAKLIVLPNSTGPDQIQELTPYLAGDELVVLDGYHFNVEYEKCVKTKSAAVVTIDDIPGRHFVSDAIINFCGAVKATDYSREFYTQLYSGLSYLFLRRPFLRTNPDKKNLRTALLVNMGGADPENKTFQVLNQIIEAGFSEEINVVIGPGYRFRESLDQLLRARPAIYLKQGLTAEQMFELMSRCTMAVLPPSTVALEYLSTGGQLFLNLTADNQRCIYTDLRNRKLADDFSGFAAFVQHPPKSRSVIGTNSAFGGASLERVKKLFQSISLSSQLNFRSATADDAALVYGWATDPDTRRFSYSKSDIVWQDHVAWFGKKISDSRCVYFLVEIGGSVVGQIRFDASADEQKDCYVLSYLIDKGWRGKGLGTSVLTRGILALRAVTAVRQVVGYVQNVNAASIKAFENAGFNRTVSLEYADSSKFELSF